jgi:hypothetical protein
MSVWGREGRVVSLPLPDLNTLFPASANPSQPWANKINERGQMCADGPQAQIRI